MQSESRYWRELRARELAERQCSRCHVAWKNARYSTRYQYSPTTVLCAECRDYLHSIYPGKS